ncbi:MAG: hypothetical protein WCD27_01275 [Candidatus Acidiferrales bacterium]
MEISEKATARATDGTTTRAKSEAKAKARSGETRERYALWLVKLFVAIETAACKEMTQNTEGSSRRDAGAAETPNAAIMTTKTPKQRRSSLRCGAREEGANTPSFSQRLRAGKTSGTSRTIIRDTDDAPLALGLKRSSPGHHERAFQILDGFVDILSIL